LTWRIHKRDTTHRFEMTHLYAWHELFMCQRSCIHTFEIEMTLSHMWYATSIHMTGLILMCDMTLSYVWRDSFICVTWRIHECDLTHAYVYVCAMMKPYHRFSSLIWIWEILVFAKLSLIGCRNHSIGEPVEQIWVLSENSDGYKNDHNLSTINSNKFKL